MDYKSARRTGTSIMIYVDGVPTHVTMMGVDKAAIATQSCVQGCSDPDEQHLEFFITINDGAGGTCGLGLAITDPDRAEQVADIIERGLAGLRSRAQERREDLRRFYERREAAPAATVTGDCIREVV